MKAVGIDPGLAATGIGIVEGGYNNKIINYSFGVINTYNNTSLTDRLNKIFLGLKKIFEQEKPNIIILEDIFSLTEYPKSGITLGKVTGVVLLAGVRSDIPIIEISVSEAKQILTGNGKASKTQLELAVRNLLNVPILIKPNHASDALALALIGLYRYNNRL